MTNDDNLLALPMNGTDVETLLLADFLAADERRPVSFVTNFGDWPLPDGPAQALASDVGHLEWFHDTGELVLIGAVPEAGAVDENVPEPTTRESDAVVAVDEAANLLGGPLGAPGMVFGTPSGGVRETVVGGVVGEGTRVAVLAVIEHGPRVHEILWGWHRKHRREDGWGWLIDRLGRLDA
jgi:hypothetical protein